MKITSVMWSPLVYRPPFGQLPPPCTTESSSVCFSCLSHRPIQFFNIYPHMRLHLILSLLFWVHFLDLPWFSCYQESQTPFVLACSQALFSIHTTTFLLFYHHSSSHKEAPPVLHFYLSSRQPWSQHHLFWNIEPFLLAWLTITEFMLSYFLTP